MTTQVSGTSVPRAQIWDKVTGRVRYGGDRSLPDMLYVRLLRSPHAKARIRKVDKTAALAADGVVAVFSAADFAPSVPLYGPYDRDQPLLADGEAKFHGEVVAATVAVNDDAAVAAAERVKVSYEELAPVCTLEDALKEGAPLVHAGTDSNVYREWRYDRGDVEAVRGTAHHTIRNTYWYPMVYHFPIENYACIAAPDGDGVCVYSAIQHPHLLRRVIAEALGFPLSKVRVVAEEIGGAFGGKGYPKHEALAAWIALRVGRPVKITFSLSDGFFMARRLRARVDITTGFDGKGCILFQDIAADYLMGAYADAAPRIISKAGYTGTGTYRTPNARIRARGVCSNTVPCTAFRGFGMPHLVLALESQMNLAARHFRMDPLAMRIQNLPAKGDVLIPGDTLVDGDWAEGLARAATQLGWGGERKPNRGKGLAIGMKSGIHASVAHAIVRLHSDGSASLLVGTTEMGQGARTVLAQMAADRLGIPFDSVAVVMGDTGTTPFDTATAGSRSTVSMGTAVVRACDDILDQLREMAQSLYGSEGVELHPEGGRLRGGTTDVSFAQVMSDYYGIGRGEVLGRGIFRGKRDDQHPLGGWADFWEVIFVGVEVEVDPGTGRIHVLDYSCVTDIGKMINPLQCEGQDEGGTVQGLGQALMEEMLYSESGVLLNGNATDYRVPTIRDIPSHYTGSFIENRDGPGPYGSKGLGEAPAIPVGAAVAGAVFDATGFFPREIPITPERLFTALRERADGS